MEGLSNHNRVEFEKVNESLIKYLAGLLDADGCLSFVYTKDSKREEMFSVGLSMHLGSASSIDRHNFVESLPLLTEMGNSRRISNYKGKGYYTNWVVCKRAHLEMILPRLIKHMVIKAKHWQWMLEVWRDYRSRDYGSKSIHATEREILEQAKKESRKLNVGPIKPKNHPTWAWLAGYLDGDGYYLHRDPKKKRYSMVVGACAHITDISVLEFLKKSFGGKITTHSQSDSVKEWYRSLSNQNRSFVLRFLPKIVKHSRLKKHKIEQIIHHHQQRLSV